MKIEYREPDLIKAAEKICLAANKENRIPLLSKALLVLRQLGPAGLRQWIKYDETNRKFIIKGLRESGFSTTLSPDGYEQAWTESENLSRVLAYAKYYAKTMK